MYYVTITAKRKNGKRHIHAPGQSSEHGSDGLRGSSARRKDRMMDYKAIIGQLQSLKEHCQDWADKEEEDNIWNQDVQALDEAMDIIYDYGGQRLGWEPKIRPKARRKR